MRKPSLQATTRRRRSIRLREYDYSQTGVYFFTIVTEERACLFGIVDGQEMLLNEAGTMIRQVWLELPDRFAGVATDEFIVMPNHIHGLVSINNPVGAPLVGARGEVQEFETRATTRVAPTPNQDTAEPREATKGDQSRATTRVAPTPDGRYALGDIVGAFKSLTTVAYIRGVKTQRWPQFSGKLWQRNYFEHVVRNEESLTKIRQYIRDNPLRWEFDKENPLVVSKQPRDR